MDSSAETGVASVQSPGLFLGRNEQSLQDEVGGSQFDQLLNDTNRLLSAIGISAKPISSAEELSRVASSMIVAIFESIFETRLEDIIRNPESREQYIHNAQMVIDHLSDRIQMDLAHITGESVVNGDFISISHLVSLFARVVMITDGTEDANKRDQVQRPLESWRGAMDPEDVVKHQNDQLRRARDFMQDSISVRREQEILMAFYICVQTRSSLDGRSPWVEKPALEMNRSSRHNSIGSRRSQSQEETLSKRLKDARNMYSHALLRQAHIQELQERQHSARSRRNLHQHHSQKMLALRNKLKIQRSLNQQQRNWEQELDNLEQSLWMKRRNDGQIMITKLHSALLKQLHSWKREESKQMREKIVEMEEDAKWHIKSVQSLFESRLSQLQEKIDQCDADDVVLCSAQRQLRSNVIKTLSQQYKSSVCSSRNRILQKREKQRFRSEQRNKALLASLSAEKWEDSLRN